MATVYEITAAVEVIEALVLAGATDETFGQMVNDRYPVDDRGGVSQRNARMRRTVKAAVPAWVQMRKEREVADWAAVGERRACA